MVILVFFKKISVFLDTNSLLNPIKILAILLSANVLLTVSCNSDEPATPTESPNKISIVSGNFQTGFQDAELPEVIEIKLADAGGNGVANKVLKAEVIKGDGHLLDAEVTTNSSGIAVFRWQLGKEAFNNIRVMELEFPNNFVELSAKSKFIYSIPEIDNDGWPVQSIESVLTQPAKAMEAVDNVRWGSYPEVHSIVLAVNGKLVLDNYFPGTTSTGDFVEFNRNIPHELHSSSKTFRSALIGIAIDKGYLNDENVPLSTIFPELPYLGEGGKENLLLKHILTMSSGLEWDETVPAPNSLSEMYTLPYGEWYSYVLSKPLVSNPGATFVYNTGASLILNRILAENVSPSIVPFITSNYSDLVESDEPFGAGYPLSSEAKPREMAKLGQVYLDEGKWKNNQVISKDWVDKSIMPVLTVNTNYDYGYHWWLREIATSNHSYSSFSAIGFGGQYIIVVKELNLVAVFTGGNFQTQDKVMEIMANYVLPAFE